MIRFRLHQHLSSLWSVAFMRRYGRRVGIVLDLGHRSIEVSWRR